MTRTTVLLAISVIALVSAVAASPAPKPAPKVDLSATEGWWYCRISDWELDEFLSAHGEKAAFHNDPKNQQANATLRHGVLSVTWPAWPDDHTSFVFGGPIKVDDGIARLKLQGTMTSTHGKDVERKTLDGECNRIAAAIDLSDSSGPARKPGKCLKRGDGCGNDDDCCAANAPGHPGNVCLATGDSNLKNGTCQRCLGPGAHVPSEASFDQCCSWATRIDKRSKAYCQ